MNPYVFDNTYFQELMLDTKSKYLKTPADLELIASPEFKKWVEIYAEDEELFFEHYAEAHIKVSEWGHDDLICEIESSPIVDGGYQENGNTHWSERVMKMLTTSK
mmetsp:Transcript_6258/g.10629  ORF Transcript_6258/g.10629 Transcript_6258/m.10629 type:complete len:105 (-) Transcript_6258:77-391(-)